MTTQADIGNRIREARERLGISQRDLADAVGKDQGAIYEYGNGKQKTSHTGSRTESACLSGLWADR